MLCKSYPEPGLRIGIENASQMSFQEAQIGPHIFKKNWGNHARAPGALLVLPVEFLLAHAGQFLSFPGIPLEGLQDVLWSSFWLRSACAASKSTRHSPGGTP